MTAPACRWTLVAAVSMSACIRIPDRDLRLVDAGGAPDAERAADGVPAPDAVPAPDDGGRPAPDASSVADAAVATDSASVVDAASAMDGGSVSDARPASDGGTSVTDADTPVGVDAGTPEGFALIPAGTFTMGTPDTGGACVNGSCELPHSVEITRPFLIGVTEVTVHEWNLVMVAAERVAQAGCVGGRCPVTNITWREAVDYCIARSFSEGKPNCYRAEPPIPDLGCAGYRLPTEAEWEYAARGGTDGARWNEPRPLSEIAWYIDNSGDVLHVVGARPPNLFGLSDVYGNANEWVHDWFAPYPNGGALVSDPLGGSEDDSNGRRVLRGGGFRTAAEYVRSAYRGSVAHASGTSNAVGFRVVLGLPDGSAQ